MATGDAEATEEKIGWIREAAGARFDDIELNVTVFAAIVTDEPEALAERIAPQFGTTVEGAAGRAARPARTARADGGAPAAAAG